MVSTKAHLNQHDNNQCKNGKDDHKNFLPILFYPFVSGFAFSALSFSSFRSLPVMEKIPELAIQSGQYRKNEATDNNNNKKEKKNNYSNKQQP